MRVLIHVFVALSLTFNCAFANDHDLYGTEIDLVSRIWIDKYATNPKV